MRHLNSASQKQSRVQLFVFVVASFAIATSGCTKLQQQTGFKPIPQPRSLTDNDKRSVEEILQRQDEVRIAAEKAAAEAAAEAEAAAAEAEALAADAESALETEAAETTLTPPLVPGDTVMMGSIEAAIPPFNVAQVSYETEAEVSGETTPATETPIVAPIQNTPAGFSEFTAEAARGVEAMEDISAEAMNQFESAAEEAIAHAPFNNNVTLTANVDDLEGVPFNIARDEIDLSQANFLRPSSDPELAQTSPSDADNEETEAATQDAPTSSNSFESDPPPLPLQPMLFNASTRTRKTTVEGTLRPLSPMQRDFEPEVEVNRVDEFTASPSPAVLNSNPAPQGFGPLAPLRNPNTIKLDSREVETVENRTLNSRLLEPITRTVEAETFEIPNTDFIPKVVPQIETTTVEVAVDEPTVVEPTTVEPAPEMVSEEIIVVDRAPPVQPEPIASVAPEAAPEVADTSGHPVVDKSLSEASASYLKPPAPPINVNEEAFIPAEVLEDVKVVVDDIAKEMEANSIPVESFPVVNNDFKIQPASNTTPAPMVVPAVVTPPEPIQINEEELGEPMFDNNDFAEPESPGNGFVPPMTIVPAEVPMIEPKPLNVGTAEFGGDVNLEAPPETDTIVAHVASLPITEDRQPAIANSKVPPVGVSTLMELNAVTWKSRLDEAIELAEERLNRMNNPADSVVVNLRLLKALRGQMEQMETTSGTSQHSENESQYWQHQLEAITSMLGSPTGANQAITDYHRHQTAHKTLEHLRNAVSQLESIASLKVGSGQFCTEITGFGQFRTFASNEFAPGQKMLVYCEVENYNTLQNESATGAEFRTRLKGSFAIYDANGKVVQQAEYPTVDDIARKRRRDFYMYMPVTLGDLPSGQYVLHALVEDVYGNKTASLDPPLQFSVK